MSTLLWLHEDYVQTRDVPDYDEAVFIWDQYYLERQNYSLKQLVFIYESLVELPISIYQGSLVNSLQELMSDFNRLIYAYTLNQDLTQVAHNIQQTHQVECFYRPQLVTYPQDASFRRFFQFWKRVKPELVQNYCQDPQN